MENVIDRFFHLLSVDSFSSLEDKFEACLDGLETIDENAKNVDFGERKRGKKDVSRSCTGTFQFSRTSQHQNKLIIELISWHIQV